MDNNKKANLLNVTYGKYPNLCEKNVTRNVNNNTLRNTHQSAIGRFTVMDGSEAGVDLVLIQAFLLYYVNQVILMLTSIFQGQFP